MIAKMNQMTPYERDRLSEIKKWKSPSKGPWESIKSKVLKPVVFVTDAVMDNYVGKSIGATVNGILDLVNDLTSWTVRSSSIYSEFRNSGHNSVHGANDIRCLSLQDVDKVVGYLAAKYKLMALAEGVGAGTLGVAGIALDIPALVALNLRAIGEYATYYGFDVETEAERHFAMEILMLDAAPSQSAKTFAFSELHKIALGVARRKTWKDLEKNLIVRGIQEVAKMIGVRLTKAKLADVVPVIGGVMGGGYNAWYTSCTCRSARYLYQERFLAEKYGASILE